MVPVVWCPTVDCAAPTALTGALPGQFIGEPHGDRVLITEEYHGSQPAVYAAGQAAPVWSGPAGALAMWAPPGL